MINKETLIAVFAKNVPVPLPAPIFDNLNHMPNPFKQRNFTAGIEVTGADVDYEYALKFLYSYRDSTATFNAYRRELERLLQWAWYIEKMSILRFRREHLEDFIRFCQNPPQAWIGTKNVARFINLENKRQVNAEWRPFVVSVPKSKFKDGSTPDKKAFLPSEAAVKATFTALSSFYRFLYEESLVPSNPVSLIRQKSKFISKSQNVAPVRRISNLQWDYVIETAELLAADDPVRFERTLFVMMCLFTMYLRVSELVADERSTPVMGDFRKDHDGNWWFHVRGKGNKTRTIAVCNEMLKALKRYRKTLGLTALPTPDDKTPLVAKNIGTGPIESTRLIRILVQECFDAAYDRMQNDELEEDGAELRAATVHWLRHTGISEDVKFRPREHVRDDAGHSSMATTDRYIESDLRERHRSNKYKQVRDI